MDTIETLEKNPELSLSNNPLARWDVALEPLQFADGGRTKFHALRATDNGAMIGQPVTDRYGVIHNSKLLEVVGKATSGSQLQLFNVGSVSKRGKVFLQFKIPQMFRGAGRDMEAFLNFLNPLDKTGNFTANTGNNWIVCQNSFRKSLSHKGKIVDVRVRHSIGSIGDLENLPEIIDAAVGVQAEFSAAMNELANVPVKGGQDAARNIFAGFLFAGKEMKTRGANQVESLAGLFVNGKGNRGQDASDLFGAATDFWSHEVPGEDNTEAEKMEFSEFATGQRRKTEFWAELWNEKESRPRISRIKELHAEGVKALATLAN